MGLFDKNKYVEPEILKRKPLYEVFNVWQRNKKSDLYSDKEKVEIEAILLEKGLDVHREGFNQEELMGIKGWLHFLFALIDLSVWGSGFLIGMMILALFTGAEIGKEELPLLLIFPYFAYQFFTANSMMNFKRRAKLLLIGSFIFASIISIVIVTAANRGDFDPMMVVLSLPGLIFWSLYVLLSRRVNNTMIVH